MVITFLVTFMLLEGSLRLIKLASYNDRAFYMALKISPDKNYWKKIIFAEPDQGYHKYDQQLGWGINGNAKTKNLMYQSNSIGIRSDKEYSINKDSSKLRIALFGDSYTHGDDVFFNETWGYYLKEELLSKGVSVEVLNFGVGGYGTDQAFLRFIDEGLKMEPDIVVLGFQLENFWRNVNVFRPKYSLYSGIPYSKPKGTILND